MSQKIVLYPDPVLRKKATPVSRISREILDLIDEMTRTMVEADGVGLAANQVGSLHRIFVINTTPHDATPTPVVMINPEIIDQEGSVIEQEGCLSFPNLYVTIDRADRVTVHAKNAFNEAIVYETTGLLARAVQHEVDHLNGVLIIDHVSTDEDKEAVEQWQKNVRPGVEV
ncbi:peptide deformylase [candidate division WOR-3 bacterium]|nr:peptide deformylase [candidate division WOR-3 bacterium]